MRKVGGDPNDAPTTLKLFPYKKSKQQEKEYQKRQQRQDLPPDDPYQMSPKQLKASGRAEAYKPDFDYAFGQTAPPKGAPTPEQVAYGERAPKKDMGRIEATPSDADVVGKVAGTVLGTNVEDVGIRAQIRQNLAAGGDITISPEHFDIFTDELARRKREAQAQ
jgi:hypothetical protein